jgi:hypothetical protein
VRGDPIVKSAPDIFQSQVRVQPRTPHLDKAGSLLGVQTHDFRDDEIHLSEKCYEHLLHRQPLNCQTAMKAQCEPNNQMKAFEVGVITMHMVLDDCRT